MENHEALDTLGERVRWARIQKGYEKQLDFALACKIEVSAISAIENRPQTKSVYAQQIADTLELDISWLLSGTGSPWISDIEEDNTVKIQKQINRLTNEGKLSQSDFESVQTYIDFLAAQSK